MQETVTSVLSTPAEIADRIAEVLSDKLALNIVLLDLAKQSNFADYFIVAAGDNERHMKALRDAVDEAMSAAGLEPTHIEGTADSGWILIDYGIVVVHIFSPALRSYYRLEELWGKAAPVVHFP